MWWLSNFKRTLDYFLSPQILKSEWWFYDNIFIMKYYNKTRTIEQKVLDREISSLLREQNDLLKQVLAHLEKSNSWAPMKATFLSLLLMLVLLLSCGSLQSTTHESQVS